MKKIGKGALAMVLVGSVTFTVTNTLLSGHAIKRAAQVIASTISGPQTKKGHTGNSLKLPGQFSVLTNVSSQGSGKENSAENTEKKQTPSSDEQNVQMSSSNQFAAVLGGLTNHNNSAEALTAIQTTAVPAVAVAANPVDISAAPAAAAKITVSNVNAPKTGTEGRAPTVPFSEANGNGSAGAAPASAPAASGNGFKKGTAATASAAPAAANKKAATNSNANKKGTAGTASAAATVPKNSAAKRSASKGNHGQQVSQLAIEKSANHKNVKQPQ